MGFLANTSVLEQCLRSQLSQFQATEQTGPFCLTDRRWEYADLEPGTFLHLFRLPLHLFRVQKVVFQVCEKRLHTYGTGIWVHRKSTIKPN